MNDQIKKEDEIYCPECGKPIKRNAVICINCGVQVKELKNIDGSSNIENHKNIGTKEISSNLAYVKNKMTAVIMVVFLGFFGWLYIYKCSASKFWIALSIVCFLLILYGITGGSTIINGLQFFVGFGTWLWAVIDTGTKPDIFFTNYPNG